MNAIDTDRRAAGILGLLVGDALGVPFEFHAPQDIPERFLIDMIPPAGFRRAHFGIEPGTYSDDGAQALILLDSLRTCEGFHLDTFAQMLVAWQIHGSWAVDRRVFDIGSQTSRALARLRAGEPPALSGPRSERDNGNGSLMRVLPVGLWFEDPHEVVHAAVLSSYPTHGHPWSLVSCALLGAWAWAIRKASNPDPEATWSTAVEIVRESPWIGESRAIFEKDFEKVLEYVDGAATSGDGFVLNTLTAARRLVRDEASYADVVRAAIALGHDTDTTAAVAGGIAGVLYGVGGDRGIPESWIMALRGMRDVKHLLRAIGWIPSS